MMIFLLHRNLHSPWNNWSKACSKDRAASKIWGGGVCLQKAERSRLGGPMKAFWPWCLQAPGPPASAPQFTRAWFPRAMEMGFTTAQWSLAPLPTRGFLGAGEALFLLQKLHPDGLQEPVAPWNWWQESRLANRESGMCHLPIKKGHHTPTPAPGLV